MHSTPQSKGLSATSETPWFGVHVLSQFGFCERAGLIEYEQATDDEGEEEDFEAPGPRLDYVPEFEPHLIQRDVGARLEIVKRRLAIAGGIFAAVNLIVGIAVGFPWILPSLLVTLVTGLWLCGVPIRKFQLAQSRWREWESARAAEPDPNHPDAQPVHWFCLLRAGYEALPMRDKLRDPRLHLAGKPWRILRKGNALIPVFRIKRGRNLHLRRSHFIRMAAYCHLLKVAEGCESPFGIVLYPESYRGMAVRNDPRNRNLFHSTLREARAIVTRSCAGQDPGPPMDQRVCSGCPCGFPRVEGRIDTIRFGEPLPAYSVAGVDDRPYHSQCGDRFRWVPPHRRAFEKELR